VKTKLTKLHNENKNCEMTEPVSGRQPVLALLMRLLLAAVLVLPVFGAQAGVVFTTLYSFTGTNDGAFPYAGLVQGNDGYFYGTTSAGGTNGAGTVFKISTKGVLASLYAFGSITNEAGVALDGANPWGLVQSSDGYLYGTTYSGGTNGTVFGGYGTVFRINTNGALTILYSFTGTNEGAYPYAGLVQGSDGSFYGTTSRGGTNEDGTVFKMSTNGALATLYDFGTVTDTYGSPLDGASPYAGLVQGNDGYFYGTTAGGGTNRGSGTVFKISTNGLFSSLYSFTGGNDGAYPEAGLVQGSDGNFYGTTSWDGTNSIGTVFRISTNGALTSLYSFINGTGSQANGLVQGSDGNLYGTTCVDGYYFEFEQVFSYGAGTVFKISTNGAYTSLYSFDTDNGTNGANPQAGLVQGSDGNFYGTTSSGGTFTNQFGQGCGTIFRLTIVPEPQLSIIPSGPYVILTWPTNAFVFTLQSSTSLDSSASWSTNSLAPVVIGGQNVVINPISGTQMFFRLSQ